MAPLARLREDFIVSLLCDSRTLLMGLLMGHPNTTHSDFVPKVGNQIPTHRKAE